MYDANSNHSACDSSLIFISSICKPILRLEAVK